MKKHEIKIAGHKWDDRYYYSPNSIMHGMLKSAYGGPTVSEMTLLKASFERINDFLEFLFDHSEHLDHITYREAWDEFEIYEAKTSWTADKVRDHRTQLTR